MKQRFGVNLYLHCFESQANELGAGGATRIRFRRELDGSVRGPVDLFLPDADAA